MRNTKRARRKAPWRSPLPDHARHLKEKHEARETKGALAVPPALFIWAARQRRRAHENRKKHNQFDNLANFSGRSFIERTHSLRPGPWANQAEEDGLAVPGTRFDAQRTAAAGPLARPGGARIGIGERDPLRRARLEL